jgi:hypothetical protein
MHRTVSHNDVIIIMSDVTQVDLCTPNPCKNASVCVDYGHYLACSCYPGYAGATCELDIDECASSPCRHGGTCRDAVNGFACDCLPDYFGPTCELSKGQG